jgi:hypothetical protein
LLGAQPSSTPVTDNAKHLFGRGAHSDDVVPIDLLAGKSRGDRRALR